MLAFFFILSFAEFPPTEETAKNLRQVVMAIGDSSKLWSFSNKFETFRFSESAPLEKDYSSADEFQKASAKYWENRSQFDMRAEAELLKAVRLLPEPEQEKLFQAINEKDHYLYLVPNLTEAIVHENARRGIYWLVENNEKYSAKYSGIDDEGDPIFEFESPELRKAYEQYLKPLRRERYYIEKIADQFPNDIRSKLVRLKPFDDQLNPRPLMLIWNEFTPGWAIPQSEVDSLIQFPFQDFSGMSPEERQSKVLSWSRRLSRVFDRMPYGWADSIFVYEDRQNKSDILEQTRDVADEQSHRMKVQLFKQAFENLSLEKRLALWNLEIAKDPEGKVETFSTRYHSEAIAQALGAHWLQTFTNWILENNQNSSARLEEGRWVAEDPIFSELISDKLTLRLSSDAIQAALSADERKKLMALDLVDAEGSPRPLYFLIGKPPQITASEIVPLLDWAADNEKTAKVTFSADDHYEGQYSSPEYKNWRQKLDRMSRPDLIRAYEFFNDVLGFNDRADEFYQIQQKALSKSIDKAWQQLPPQKQEIIKAALRSQEMESQARQNEILKPSHFLGPILAYQKLAEFEGLLPLLLSSPEIEGRFKNEPETWALDDPRLNRAIQMLSDSYIETDAKLALKHLPLEEKIKFFSPRMLSVSAMQNINLKETFKVREILTAMDPSIFLTEDFVGHLLQTTNVSEGDAKYDGHLSRQDYSNKELEGKIYILVRALAENPIGFMTAFSKLSKERQGQWMKDTNSEEGRSRSELFDLMAHEIKRQFLRGSDLFDGGNPWGSSLNEVALTAVIKASLGELLDAKSTEPTVYFWVEPMNGVDRLSLICSAGDSELYLPKAKRSELDSLQSYNRRILGQRTLSFSIISLTLADELQDSVFENAEWKCGSKVFKLRAEREKALGEVKNPRNYDLTAAKKRGYVDVLASYALPSETSLKSILASVGFIMSNGFVPTRVERIRNLRDHYLASAKNADVLIPSGHSLNLSHFKLGMAKSIRLTFYRKARPKLGEKNDIQFSVIFPIPNQNSDFQMVGLSDKEISALFCERQDDHPLFVMNVSCGSESTIKAWMRAYRNSVQNQMKENKIDAPESAQNVPIIIGAKRGFATSDPFVTLGHMQFPFDLINRMSKNEPLDEILKSLGESKPTPANLASIAAVFDKAGKYKGSQSFEPACNVTDPKVFKMSGNIHFELINKANPEERLVY